MRDGTLAKRIHRYKGDTPLFELCVTAQKYYKHYGFTTQVLPASLTSVHEIISLAGVDHITIAPKPLRELASTETASSQVSNSLFLVDEAKLTADEIPPKLSLAENEDGFRMAMTRDAKGANEGKLIQVRREHGTCERPGWEG